MINLPYFWKVVYFKIRLKTSLGQVRLALDESQKMYWDSSFQAQVIPKAILILLSPAQIHLAIGHGLVRYHAKSPTVSYPNTQCLMLFAISQDYTVQVA